MFGLKSTSIFLALLSLGSFSEVYASFNSEVEHLVESTKLQDYSDITSFLRLPKQLFNGNEHTRTLDQNSQEARGILMLRTWATDLEEVQTIV